MSQCLGEDVPHCLFCPMSSNVKDIIIQTLAKASESFIFAL